MMWQDLVVRKKWLKATVQKHIRAFPTPPMKEPDLPLPWKNDSKVLKQPLEKQQFCTALCRAAPVALFSSSPCTGGFSRPACEQRGGKALCSYPPAHPWRSRQSWTGCTWERCWPRSGPGQQPQAAGTEHHCQHHPDTHATPQPAQPLSHTQGKQGSQKYPLCSITSKFCLD